MPFNPYPEEPLAPLPDPDESGKITLTFQSAGWLEPTYPERNPDAPWGYDGQLAGATYPVSSPYRYNRKIFQAFIDLIGYSYLFLYWRDSGPLRLPSTFAEASEFSNWTRVSGGRRTWDWYHTADMTANGWASVLPGTAPSLIFTIQIFKPLPFQCFYVPYDDGTGYHYYAIEDDVDGHFNQAYWWYRDDDNGGIPSIVPLLPALLGPFLPLLPFLLPLAPAFPVMPLIGIGDGAYGAGSSANNNAGRRHRKKEN